MKWSLGMWNRYRGYYAESKPIPVTGGCGEVSVQPSYLSFFVGFIPREGDSVTTPMVYRVCMGGYLDDDPFYCRYFEAPIPYKEALKQRKGYQKGIVRETAMLLDGLSHSLNPHRDL